MPEWMSGVPTGIVLTVLAGAPLPMEDSLYRYGEFTPGTAVVWKPSGLLASPEATADTVAALPSGTRLRIGEPPAGSVRWRGIASPWYPASLPDGARGFIAGTDLAMHAGLLGDGTVILCALTDLEGASSGSLEAAYLAVSPSGEFRDSLGAFLPGAGGLDRFYYTVFLSRIGEGGLRGLQDIFLLHAVYEACGRMNTTQIVGWDGQRLVAGPFTASMTESGLFRHSEGFVMPWDSGGMPDRILKISLDEEWDDDALHYVETARDTTVFQWDGREFSRD